MYLCNFLTVSIIVLMIYFLRNYMVVIGTLLNTEVIVNSCINLIRIGVENSSRVL